MTNCLQCGSENPKSKGNKARKYCSKKCSQKFHYNKHYDRKHKDWGTRAEQRIKEREEKRRQFEWHQANMYSAKRIEEEFGMHRNSAHTRSRYLGIEGKVIGGSPNGGSHKFFTYDEVQRILHEEITPEHDNEFTKEYRKRARERSRIRNEDPEYKKKQNEYRKERKAKDPAYKLKLNVSALVYDALVTKQGRTKGGSTFEHLPYTPAELKEHIEKQFDEHMNWNNYGSYWHLDHVIPQAALPYDSLEHPNFKKCWALNNLAPLEAKLNASKGSLHEGKRYSYSEKISE